jgi:antitoxin component YwqK of YwqJK toxin-antitoxin module
MLFRKTGLVLLFVSFVLSPLFSQTEFSTKHDSVNKPYGVFRYYDEDGKPTAVTTFEKDGKSCHTIMYHRTGQLMGKGKYVNELRDSVWEMYSIDTLVARESYLAGKKNGTCYTYYQGAGVLEMTTWKKGIQDGPWKIYREDGHLKGEGNYVNGCLEGIVRYYCPDGQLRIQCSYHACLPDGEWVFYKCGSTKIDHKLKYKNGNIIGDPGFDPGKELQKGLEEFKDRNEQEHQGGPGKKETDGGY